MTPASLAYDTYTFPTEQHIGVGAIVNFCTGTLQDPNTGATRTSASISVQSITTTLLALGVQQIALDHQQFANSSDRPWFDLTQSVATVLQGLKTAFPSL
jgi:hypothetical protein